MITHIDPDRLRARIAVPVRQLCRGELEHIFSTPQERPPRRVIDACLGAVEALEGTLLAGQRLDIRRVPVVDWLEEAGVDELPIHHDRLAEDNRECDSRQQQAAQERVLPEICVNLIGRDDVEHVGEGKRVGRRVEGATRGVHGRPASL